MSPVEVLILKARRCGITFSVEGNRLQAMGLGKVSQEFMDSFKKYKYEIITFLEKELQGVNRKFPN